MKIQILSQRKKHHGIDEYTKREVKEVDCFVYDEDVFWFDYDGKRFGLPIIVINELRKKTIAKLQREIRALEKQDRQRRKRRVMQND